MGDDVQAKGKTDIIVGMHEADAVRDAEDRRAEREDRKEERAAAQKTIRAWQLTASFLIFVLLTIFAGLLGVGVSGHIPGLGDIKITQPKGDPSEEAEAP